MAENENKITEIKRRTTAERNKQQQRYILLVSCTRIGASLYTTTISTVGHSQ